MTVKQMQCLLTYLGYDPGVIDGIDGKNTQAALAKFRADYGGASDLVQAVAGTSQKTDFWQGIRYFRREEFRCKCGRYCDGFPAEPDRTLVRLADSVRAHFGAPATVSSGVRCERHNANVGGVAGSRHKLGKAMDFSVRGKTAQQVLQYVQTLPDVRYAYAIDGSFVHMDVQ